MPDAQQLKAYLADRDVPCPGCGYNLRDSTAADCPECGEQLYIHQALRSMCRRRVHWAWFVLPFLWLVLLAGDGVAELFQYPFSQHLVIAVVLSIVACGIPAVLLITALRRNWHRWQIPWVVILGNVLGLGLPVAIKVGGQLALFELGW